MKRAKTLVLDFKPLFFSRQFLSLSLLLILKYAGKFAVCLFVVTLSLRVVFPLSLLSKMMINILMVMMVTRVRMRVRVMVLMLVVVMIILIMVMVIMMVML